MKPLNSAIIIFLLINKYFFLKAFSNISIVNNVTSNSSQLLNRIDRLERLIKERYDIVHDYNIQQLESIPVADLLKDYIWKTLKSRPLFNLKNRKRY